MNTFISDIFRKVFIGTYVSAGYLRHYLTKAGAKSALPVLAAMVLGILAFYLYYPKTETIPGNEALNAAYDHENRGQYHAAHADFEKAYQIFSKEKNSRGMYVALNNLAETDTVLGDLGEALYHYDTALRLAQQAGNKDGQIYLLSKHASLKLRLGRVDAARAHLYDAVQIARDDGNDAAAGSLFTSVGNLERDIGNSRRARFAYRSAREHFTRESIGSTGHQLGMAYLHLNQGVLEGNLENFDAALSSYLTARDLFKTQNNTEREADVLHRMATIEKKRGRTRAATNYYNEAIILYGSIGKTDDIEDIREEAGALIL